MHSGDYECKHLLVFANKAKAVMKMTRFLDHHFIEHVNVTKSDIK